jgi:hypothetical protein
MPGYASEVPLIERWATVAYVRALQLSQNVLVNDLTAGEREQLGRSK